MRIGYYVPPTLLWHHGIRLHVDETLEAWRRFGHEGILLSGVEPPGSPFLTHVRGDRREGRRAAQLVRERKLDHLHVRLFMPTRPWLKVPASVTMSLEIHARQWRPENPRDVVRVLLGVRTVPRLLSAATCGVFITSELSQVPEYRRLPKRAAIGNGIKLTPALPAPANAQPRIGMSVGARNAWQGLTEFSQLAQACPQYEFVAIAPEALGAYVRSEVAGSRVTVALTNDRATYMQQLSELDVAMGSLALHREGLLEAASLKVRDYVVAGIPTVLPYLDTNLSGLRDDALLECTDPANDERFRAWVESMVGRRVVEETRQAISIEAVEKKRLQAIGAL